MLLEKAFAINAEPAAIWRELTGELASAHASAYEIERSVTNQSLSLRVDLSGGISAIISYELIQRDDHTEVVARMEPQGLRYAIFRMLTLGRTDVNYELLLVEGLSNLKRAAEGTVEDEPGDRFDGAF